MKWGRWVLGGLLLCRFFGPVIALIIIIIAIEVTDW